MLLEDYFDFLEPDVIRLKGHRIGIEDVIELYEQGYSAEQVVLYYPTLTLEEVYATLTYYLHNKPEMQAYMQRLHALVEDSIREYERREPSDAVKRIRALQESRATYNISRDTLS
ncbi:MAG: DUF433 domain-containing protein [Candidatus Promineofilum sp.]|nr:DUF433 domain-containing protein [Promineifilum sp.]